MRATRSAVDTLVAAGAVGARAGPRSPAAAAAAALEAVRVKRAASSRNLTANRLNGRLSDRQTLGSN